jgi:hypothetical protein
MFSHPEDVDDAHPLAKDEGYRGPGVYAADLNGLVAGPFDDHDQCCWWVDKALRIA